MKIQVTFNYDGVDYRYTVNEEQAEMVKYDNVWCVGLFSIYDRYYEAPLAIITNGENNLDVQDA